TCGTTRCRSTRRPRRSRRSRTPSSPRSPPAARHSEERRRPTRDGASRGVQRRSLLADRLVRLSTNRPGAASHRHSPSTRGRGVSAAGLPQWRGTRVLRRLALTTLAAAGTVLLVAAPAGALPGFGTAPVSGGSTSGPQTVISSVTVGHHAGFDRVVFTFRGPLPRYEVRYVSQVRADAS